MNGYQHTVTLSESYMDALVKIVMLYKDEETTRFISILPAGSTRENIKSLLRRHNLYHLLLIDAIINRPNHTETDVEEILDYWVDEYMEEEA